MSSLNANIPRGSLETKWTNHKFDSKLINPANKRKFKIIIVGTGLAGASAAASLAELGYNIKSFCYQDSPRRAHSIAAQGGINAAKNYTNDGDSIFRLFYDTIKGGDYRSREANVYRLAEVSNLIIDHCVAQGIPFARDYSGLLENRSFGGAQVSRTFYARGQTGQQLLLGAYGSLNKQIKEKKVQVFPRRDVLDIIIHNKNARGILCRNLITGEIESHIADAVILASGGYGNVFNLSTNAMGCNVSAAWNAYKKGAFFANPCFTQIHPTCLPATGDYQSKLTLMSESLRNDGRVWVPQKKNDARAPHDIPENERDYYLEKRYPSFGNLVPRDVASRNAKNVCDIGKGVGPTGQAVYLDFSDAINRLGKDKIREKYGNLFDMYHHITSENPYITPMRIYPASHYTMGGLWVDYNLMSTIPGLFVLGEANFSDHGANRLGASALMQGLADGYFIIPYTIGNYLSGAELSEVKTQQDSIQNDIQAIKFRISRLLKNKGNQTTADFHRRLGKLLWDSCGMSRNESNLKQALLDIPVLRDEFHQSAYIPGDESELNQELESALRVADFMELAELMVRDALSRNESCGAHFREEYQTSDGEAARDDLNFKHVSAWEYQEKAAPKQHQEDLIFENVKLTQRSYK